MAVFIRVWWRSSPMSRGRNKRPVPALVAERIDYLPRAADALLLPSPDTKDFAGVPAPDSFPDRRRRAVLRS